MAGQGSGSGVAMPADRLLHARLGHSAKVSSLSDLEYRVWTTYVLGANDFGVMRADAVAFQAALDALCARPAKAIKRCIERLVEVGLVAAFVHQGSRYLYQADWQDFQRVRYPLRPVHPLPAEAEVSEDAAPVVGASGRREAAGPRGAVRATRRATATGRSDSGGCGTSCTRRADGRSGHTARRGRRARQCGTARWPSSRGAAPWNSTVPTWARKASP